MTSPRELAPAAVVWACRDLAVNQTFLAEIGFQLDAIFPADAPRVLEMSGHGLRLRLEQSAHDGGGHLRLAGTASRTLHAPNGARIDVVDTAPSPAANAEATFVVGRLDDVKHWSEGRAGMLYRDLLPGRQRGALIASHIHIPRGGPVPDYVHFHEVTAQVIYCHAGWVRVVYEDQGEPFVMQAGDCVLQPPGIRHRVLECSDRLCVIEVSSPAEHVTRLDHDLVLPTATVRRERQFAGQRFVRHRAAQSLWQAGPASAWQACDTGMRAASNGAIDVQIVRATANATASVLHTDAYRFCCVLRGTLQLTFGTEGISLQTLETCVLPPHRPVTLAAEDAEFLEIRLATGPTNGAMASPS